MPTGIRACLNVSRFEVLKGQHHFVGSIQVFSRQDVERALIADTMSVLHRNRACYRCAAAPEHCDCPDQMEPEGAR